VTTAKPKTRPHVMVGECVRIGWPVVVYLVSDIGAYGTLILVPVKPKKGKE